MSKFINRQIIKSNTRKDLEKRLDDFISRGYVALTEIKYMPNEKFYEQYQVLVELKV